MALTDFKKYKKLDVVDVSGQPSMTEVVCLKIVDGDDSTTGTGEIVLDWTNISSEADIGIYDEDDNLLDYYFESFDASEKKAYIWVYRSWDRDGTTQLQIGYGDGPSDQSTGAFSVFDKKSGLDTVYLFNEDSGDLEDRAGVDSATVHGCSRGESGIVDGAYNLNGDGDYINLGDRSILDGDSTFILWIKKTATKSAERILWVDRGTSGEPKVSIGVQSDGYLVLQYVDSGYDVQSIVGETNVADGEWHQVVLIIDASTPDLYLDSQLECEGPDSMSSRSSSSDDYLGTIDTTDQFYEGLMDNIRIYDNHIEMKELQVLYDSDKPSPEFFSQQKGQNFSTSYEVNGTGYNHSVGAGSITAAYNTISTGYTTSVGSGSITSILRVFASGYTTSIGTGGVDNTIKISATGYTHSVGSGLLSWHDSSGHTHSVGTGSIAANKVASGSGYTHSVASEDLRMRTWVSGDGHTHSQGTGHVTTYLPTKGTGHTYSVGSVSIFARHRCAGVGYTSSFGSGLIRLRVPIASVAGYNYSAGTGAIRMRFSASGVGYTHSVGDAHLSIHGIGYTYAVGSGAAVARKFSSGTGYVHSAGSGEIRVVYTASGLGYTHSVGSSEELLIANRWFKLVTNRVDEWESKYGRPSSNSWVSKYSQNLSGQWQRKY